MTPPTPPQEHGERDEILEPLPARRRPGISFSGILIGLVIGLIIGLTYAWQIDPVVVRNTAPADLHTTDKQAYIIAAAQEYAAQQNLEQAIRRLLEVEPERNPFEVAADTTCRLIRTGQVNDLTDIGVIRNLRSIYEPQGLDAVCDTTAFNTAAPVTIVVPSVTPTFTPSITPAATKTPTNPAQAQPQNTALPTNTTPPRDDAPFRVAFVEQFCDPNNSGVIEVYVRDITGLGLPGTPVEVTWGNRQSQVFYTGLKPERGDDYADFVMDAGEFYRVSVRDSGQPSRELEAVTCDEDDTLIGYRVVIQRIQEQ